VFAAEAAFDSAASFRAKQHLETLKPTLVVSAEFYRAAAVPEFVVVNFGVRVLVSASSVISAF
jgi:hypothetical protein